MSDQIIKESKENGSTKFVCNTYFGVDFDASYIAPEKEDILLLMELLCAC